MYKFIKIFTIYKFTICSKCGKSNEELPFTQLILLRGSKISLGLHDSIKNI